jgi:hypothetical protein
VGGLAGDCATEATGATWRDGQLEITLPAQAATAAAFLRRPEAAAAVMRALETVAGRRIRHAIVLAEAAAEPAVATLVEQPRPTGVQTQAALLREAAEHPLVAHARTLFDAVRGPSSGDWPPAIAKAAADAFRNGDPIRKPLKRRPFPFFGASQQKMLD